MQELLGIHRNIQDGDFCMVTGLSTREDGTHCVTHRSLSNGRNWTSPCDLFKGRFEAVSNEDLKEMFARPATNPTEYFSYDSEGNGYDTHKTMEEAVAQATGGIASYLEDGWDESVTQVVCGVITHRATQTDREDRPSEINEEGCDGEGYYWGPDEKWSCNYKMKTIA